MESDFEIDTVPLDSGECNMLHCFYFSPLTMIEWNLTWSREYENIGSLSVSTCSSPKHQNKVDIASFHSISTENQ